MPDWNLPPSRLRACAVIALAAVLCGCAVLEATRTLPPASVGESLARGQKPPGESERTGPTAVTAPVSGEQTEPPSAGADLYQPGSGVFVRELRGPDGVTKTGEITLNFENTNLLEVVKVILADLLKLNYVIEPGVQGAVTLQTSVPLPRESLVPTLELLLRMNGAALVESGDMFQVVPRESAARGLTSPQLGNSSAPLPRGYSVRIVPLRYVSAGEMQKILEPFVIPGNIVRVDTQRNLLILAGTGREMETLLETIAVFDVDWVAGMSVALFTPDFVDAKTLASDLEKVFGDQSKGPLAGLVKLAVIDRLNALLVISPRREYLSKVAEWVDRLDQDRGGSGRRLFIYHVQNGKAADLAAVLQQVFEAREAEIAISPPELAPGLEPVELRTQQPPTLSQETEAAVTGVAPRQETLEPTRPRRNTGAAEGLQLSEGGKVRIIADEVNNALLVMATAVEYSQVSEALKRLDIVPLQVLVEATIAEVSLTDDLSQGLEWFFKNKIGSRTGEAFLDLNTPPGLGAFVPGFSYAIFSGADVRAVLNLLASESKLKVISSPSLMVLNNQTATIEVGDQVPITTQQQQSTLADANLVNSIEYRDTGVILSVTPRVNAGGLVTMEISQEVSDVSPNPDAPLAPTIQQRKINSTVAIQSGETVVLGGLIRENDSFTSSGIPGLYNIPIIGFLFGQTSDERSRTELVVLITPRAVQGAEEARQITNEFRDKMESLKPENKDKKVDDKPKQSTGTMQ
ncbi:MAG: type II secretion system secretin GspD [Gammaproteobacteria bacterium]|nr:type II secretion system secretin GspD [Gammaproteobacteria bacterium]MDH3411893.1 type II secretion system secretin GspD [Gammaproteobacteria bacterium]